MNESHYEVNIWEGRGESEGEIHIGMNEYKYLFEKIWIKQLLVEQEIWYLKFAILSTKFKSN